MTEHLVTPDRPIEIAGQTYTLTGNIKALKAIQHFIEDDVLRYLISRLLSARFDELARIVQIGIESGGAKAPALEIIEQAIVDDIGIIEARETVLAWLSLAITPKRDREKKAQELERLLAK